MNAIKKHPLVSYFVLANLISWLIWLPLLIDVQKNSNPDSPLWWLHYVGGFGPLLSAVILTWILSGKKGIKNLFGRMIGKGTSLKWHLLGFGLPLLAVVIALITYGFVQGSWIDINLLGQTEKLPGLGLLAIVLVEVIVFGYGEETGWRGFALPRHQSKHNALVATAILTVFWAIWHIPTFFYNENMMNMGLGGIIGWLLSLFTGAIVLTWLFNGSGGSIMPVALFHGMIDVVFISNAVVGKLDNYIGALLTFLAIGLILYYKPARLARGFYKI